MPAVYSPLEVIILFVTLQLSPWQPIVIPQIENYDEDQVRSSGIGGGHTIYKNKKRFKKSSIL